MNKYKIYPLLLVFSLTACKKDLFDTTLSAKDTLTEVKYSNDPEYALSNKNAQEYIGILERKQADLSQKLRKANAEEANNLLSEYHKILNTLLDSLNYTEAPALLQYNEWKTTAVFPDSIQKKEKLYDKLGIYFKETDTSSYTLSFKPGYFYQMFKNKVTPDVRLYLQLRTEDKKTPYIHDNKVIITWEQLRERVLKWENYIKKYPNNKFTELAKKNYQEYLTVYLFGTSEQPTIEYSNKKMLPEFEQEFVMMIKKNPKSISGKLTKDFVDFFINNNSNYKPADLQKKIKEYTSAEMAKSTK